MEVPSIYRKPLRLFTALLIEVRTSAKNADFHGKTPALEVIGKNGALSAAVRHRSKIWIDLKIGSHGNRGIETSATGKRCTA